MSRWFAVAFLFAVCLLHAAPAFAQDTAAPATATAAAAGTDPFFKNLITVGPSLGAGLIVIGAAMGIGRIGAASVESMARQPEAAGTINTAMVTAAALVEGATFFGLLVCLLSVFFKHF